MSGFFSASELGHGTSGGSLLKRIAVGLALVGGCTTSVLAAAISWNNPAGGNWSTAANWSPASVPGVADDAIITLNGTYTVTQDVAVSVNSLTLGGASGTQTLSNGGQSLDMSAASTVNANGIYTWNGGTIGCTTLGIAGVLNIGGAAPKTIAGTCAFNNSGTTNFTGTGKLQIFGFFGAFNNLPGANFNDQTDADINGIFSGGTFNNGGTFTKSVGVSQTISSTSPFINTGTVSVLAGTLKFDLEGGVASSGAGNTFSAVAGSVIEFRIGSTFTDTTFSGAGLKLIFGAVPTFTVGGVLTLTNVQLNSNLAPVPAGVALSGTLDWSGGQIFGGPVAIPAGSTLNISGSAAKNLASTTVINNSGTTNFTGNGTFNVFSGAFNNLPGASFNDQTDANLTGVFFGSTFNNGGTFTKSVGTNQAVGGLNFVNTGMLNAQTGTIDYSGTNFSQTAGATHLAGGSFVSNQPMQIQGGVFDGNGSAAVPFVLSGTGQLNPGTSPGAVSVSSYSQSGGTLNIEINGLAAGTQYDQLTVATGTVDLGGTLAVTRAFTPALGNQFVIINKSSAGAVSGTFSGLAEGATINLSGVVFTISYVGGDGNDVVLTVMAVPAVPTTTTLTAAPNPTTFGTNVVLTATVVGASPTGTVQFKDGAANLGGPVALAAGAATFNTSTLTVGGHPITAVYSGDGGNLPSTSAPLTVIINLVPATAAVVSSVNPTVFGNSTTFTATVTGSNPTGTVQFKDGAVNLGGPVALSSGQATFSTSSLAIGVHPITVVYSGDATNTTAISPILTQTVANGSVPAPSVSIPTLSEWMLGVLGLMLAAVVFRHHRRLRRLG